MHRLFADHVFQLMSNSTHNSLRSYTSAAQYTSYMAVITTVDKMILLSPYVQLQQFVPMSPFPSHHIPQTMTLSPSQPLKCCPSLNPVPATFILLPSHACNFENHKVQFIAVFIFDTDVQDCSSGRSCIRPVQPNLAPVKFTADFQNFTGFHCSQ